MFDADEEIVLAQKVSNELSIEQKKELSSRIESYHIVALAAFNDAQSLRISHDIDIASLADDVNL